MQFLEGVIWLDIDGALGWNESCSTAIKPTLFAQAGSLAFGHLIERGTLPVAAWCAIVATVLAVLGRLVFDRYHPQRRSHLVVVGPGGHLLWPSLDTFDLLFLACVYPLGMSFPFFFYRPRLHGLVYALSGPVSVVFAALAFSDLAEFGGITGEFGSLWCHIANLYGLLAISMPHVLKPISTHRSKLV